MTKYINFPEEYSYIQSVEIDDTIYINNSCESKETKEIAIPSSKNQLKLPTFPG